MIPIVYMAMRNMGLLGFRARGGGFEPPSSFEHWMFASSKEERDSNPAPCRAGPSPPEFRIMSSAVLKVCRLDHFLAQSSTNGMRSAGTAHEATRTRSAVRFSSHDRSAYETLIYDARVVYSSSSVGAALGLGRMASSKRIYTASNLSGATQTSATAAMVGREASTRHYR